MPVARGAERPLVRELTVADHVHGESGLDGPVLPEPTAAAVDESAVSFLAEHLGPRRAVPTGSLTNVSQPLTEYPDVRPERIVLMGGAIGLGNITPAAEFNIWADPEAAAIVFESEIELTMVGLDVTHEAIVGPERVERFRAMGRVGNRSRAARLLLGLPPRDVRVGRANGARRLGGRICHSPRAAGNGSPPGRHRDRIRAVPRPDGRRPLSAGPSLPNAHVAVGVDAAAFLDLLEERISRLT